MKKRVATKKGVKPASKAGKIYLRLAQPGKRLGELISVYEDLEKTLKNLRSTALSHGQNSAMQINLHKLVSQLSKSKRKIERKISHTLLHERDQIRHQLEKWAPRLSNGRGSKPQSRLDRKSQRPIN